MKYRIELPILTVNGWQLYEVEANSEAEALEKFKRGEETFIDQEIDVQSVGKPRVLGVAK